MFKRGKWRIVAALAVTILTANIAGAELIIDDFDEPDPETVTIIGLLSPNPTLIQTTSGGVLGGERDLLIEVTGPPEPVSYTGMIGKGLFVFGSSSDEPGAVASLQYDGVDAGDGMLNKQDLGGVDLTAHGTAFILDFRSIESGNPSETGLVIMVEGPAGSAIHVDAIPDSLVPVSYAAPFAGFVGNDAVFSNVSSINIVLNPIASANVDFVMDKVSVPEPTTSALLVLGGMALIGRRRRRKLRV